jgi:hypothetical protein
MFIRQISRSHTATRCSSGFPPRPSARIRMSAPRSTPSMRSCRSSISKFVRSLVPRHQYQPIERLISRQPSRVVRLGPCPLLLLHRERSITALSVNLHAVQKAKHRGDSRTGCAQNECCVLCLFRAWSLSSMKIVATSPAQLCRKCNLTYLKRRD